ncbi:MAG TPA: glycosyltransferase family 1 protein [Methanocella sp.]|nr:glycosyltransferase family 1 protein [Methanocella sp.]
MTIVDVAYITTRIVESDAQGNFTAAALAALKERCKGRVTLYTFAYERSPVEGVDIKFMGSPNSHGIGSNLRAMLRTRRMAKELSSYDRLVLAGPDVGALPAVHLAKRRNPSVKIVWVYHGLTPPEHLARARDRLLTRVRRAAYAYSMKRSDRIKTDSQYSRDELAGWGVDPNKVTVIPIGVDLSRFSRTPSTHTRDQFRLLYVGRLASGKRVDNLLRAIDLLWDRPVRLTIVGDGPERGRLENLAEKLYVKDRVTFAGFVPDGALPGYYRDCDAWVTASEHEGFCVPVVEAMACGRPAIVPDVTAMPETAGGAGLTYRPGDLAGLARCVERLMTDRALYDSLVRNTTAEVGRFEAGGVMARYLELIGQNGGR